MPGWLGTLLAQRRRELGLTQAEVARRLGAPASSVAALEQTPTRWQAPLLWRLANALDLPQLELALAAGVITDLPAPHPGRCGSMRDERMEDLTTDDLAYALLCLTELPPAESWLLVAIAEQRVRRWQPIGAAGAGAGVDHVGR